MLVRTGSNCVILDKISQLYTRTNRNLFYIFVTDVHVFPIRIVHARLIGRRVI